MMHLNTRTPVAGESLFGPFCLLDWKLDSIFSQKQKQFHFLPLSSRPSEMSSGPENSPASPHRTDVNRSPCVTEIQVAFLDAMSDCVQWKWFSKLLLSTSGCIWQSSMTVSCAILSEGSKVMHIQGLLPYPTQTEIPLDYLNLVTVLWMEDDERHQCFAILHWEMWFLIVWQFSQDLAQSDEPWLIFA